MNGLIEDFFKKPMRQIASELSDLFHASGRGQLKVEATGAPYWFNVLARLFEDTWEPSSEDFFLALINAEIGQRIVVGLGDSQKHPATTMDRYASQLALVMQLAVNAFARFAFMRAVDASQTRSMTLVPLTSAAFESEVGKVRFNLTLASESQPEVVAATGTPSLDRVAYCYLEWFTRPANWVDDALVTADAGRADAERGLAAEAKRRGMTGPELTVASGFDYIQAIRQKRFSASYLPRLADHFEKTVRPLIVAERVRKVALPRSPVEWIPSHDGVKVAWKASKKAIGNHYGAQPPGRPPRRLD